MDTYPVLSLSGKSFFFPLERRGERGCERRREERGGGKGQEKGEGNEKGKEGSFFFLGEDGRKEKGEDEGKGGFIDCSQAEGAVCGAWRWALRTPGLSLLSGPEEKPNTH